MEMFSDVFLWTYTCLVEDVYYITTYSKISIYSTCWLDKRKKKTFHLALLEFFIMSLRYVTDTFKHSSLNEMKSDVRS